MVSIATNCVWANTIQYTAQCNIEIVNHIDIGSPMLDVKLALDMQLDVRF